ncbi:carbohydrate ABC transporter permease [Anaerocolumna xylanovorans]|uniref:Carbohydrate ABC transporter membrane protein 2, CUT1 family (TC 3.A.1.1.-) n=1 Tax=Anaerocolumna xylanovorans DSM 12503 TaxID=1121345 RepID=A0A1M7Y5E8_9FIRM|nr:carbohydrate ABC transporter permease [Anaerocolumna xylanovorans]SHO47605.1 carbohydrate ABC transporter membrane protein 2, CUT1 family (TC 3.A.1.1.-) [Anaerocolumna xylanovorans DSM 12503]
MSLKLRKNLRSWTVTIILMVIGLLCIYPFIFMISSSFKISADVLGKPLQIIPDKFILSNYTDLFGDPYYDFAQWYKNTIVMVVTTIVLKVFIITYTAYGFAKIKFKGNGVLFLILMSALMIPGDIMLIPRYSIFKNLHILDSMWSLVLPSCFDIYFVFMLRQAFIAIPDSISEAAEIDGCHHFTIYSRIILPLAKPSIVTMVLFTFVWSWNDYMGPYIYISTISKQMLSVGIKLFTEGQVADPALQMSSATLVLIPILILFFFTQRYFVEGSTSSAVKG